MNSAVSNYTGKTVKMPLSDFGSSRIRRGKGWVLGGFNCGIGGRSLGGNSEDGRKVGEVDISGVTKQVLTQWGVVRCIP